MPMLPKSLFEITKGDLDLLCEQGQLEDEQIDFKRTVPHKDGEGQDPWRAPANGTARRIKDHGRDQLLGTIVAFANSYGGDLIVGLREQPDTNPGRAEALDPLPDCDDLANRLSQAANACIEPPLSSFQIRVVLTDQQGAGVLIMRAARSRNAPHRLTTTKDAYHRVRHETFPMTMRQIQDLTFNVTRGLEAVEQRFAVYNHRFSEWLKGHRIPQNHSQLSVHMVAVPISGDVTLDKVHNNEAIRPAARSGVLRLLNLDQGFQIVCPFHIGVFDPALRGSESRYEADEKSCLIGVYGDGGISYNWCRTVASNDQAGRQHLLYPGWFFAMVANIFVAADRFRNAASASQAEYALEIEIGSSDPLAVIRLGGQPFDPAGSFPKGRTTLPRYSIGPRESWKDSHRRIYRDFWNSIGVDGDADDVVIE